MPDRSRKRPKDANQLGKPIVDLSVGEADEEQEEKKNPAAVALGRLGGQKGGRARAESMSAKRRSEIAHLAAKKRWSRRRRNDG